MSMSEGEDIRDDLLDWRFEAGDEANSDLEDNAG